MRKMTVVDYFFNEDDCGFENQIYRDFKDSAYASLTGGKNYILSVLQASGEDVNSVGEDALAEIIARVDSIINDWEERTKEPIPAEEINDIIEYFANEKGCKYESSDLESYAKYALGLNIDLDLTAEDIDHMETVYYDNLDYSDMSVINKEYDEASRRNHSYDDDEELEDFDERKEMYESTFADQTENDKILLANFEAAIKEYLRVRKPIDTYLLASQVLTRK